MAIYGLHFLLKGFQQETFFPAEPFFLSSAVVEMFIEETLFEETRLPTKVLGFTPAICRD